MALKNKTRKTMSVCVILFNFMAIYIVLMLNMPIFGGTLAQLIDRMRSCGSMLKHLMEEN